MATSSLCGCLSNFITNTYRRRTFSRRPQPTHLTRSGFGHPTRTRHRYQGETWCHQFVEAPCTSAEQQANPWASRYHAEAGNMRCIFREDRHRRSRANIGNWCSKAHVQRQRSVFITLVCLHLMLTHHLSGEHTRSSPSRARRSAAAYCFSTNHGSRAALEFGCG